MTTRIPRQPRPDPQQTAALQTLADRYAAYYADSPETIAARQRALAEAAQDERDQATERRRDWDTAIRHAARELAGERGHAA